MIRSQVLLTPELVEEIKRIAKNQGLSQSKIIRKLLRQSLGREGIERKIPEKSKKSYLYDLNTFSLKNPRIEGFREIFSVGGKTTEIKIISDEVFRHYYKNKKFPNGFEYQVLKACQELVELTETKTLAIRRAYVVPGLENPPGPRCLGVKPEKAMAAIREIYDFAIFHRYYLKKKSQICVFLQPFFDPPPLSLPIKQDTSLPYGGYAVPLNKDVSRVRVFAVWGNNEGVQAFDAVDEYIVDAHKKIILEKNIPQKTVMLCTTQKSQSDKIPVPQDRQFEQVLSDLEILEASRIVRDLTKKYGLRRVEFSFDGQDSIFFNESAPYEIHERRLTKLDKRGVITTVSSGKDVERLRGLKSNEVAKTIVYLERNIIEGRSYDVLNGLAGLTQKFTVLYPGLSATAHAMRVLNDFGHTAIVVGNRKFKAGEEVIIKEKDSQISIESVSGMKVKSLITNLHDARLYGRETVGGKAINLSLLKSKGFNVPHGVVLTTNFFDLVVSREMKKRAKELGKTPTFNPALLKEFSQIHFNLPPKLWKQVCAAAKMSPKKKYAVRSSANVEDSTNHAFAGQFETFLNVNYQDIPEKVFGVIRSAFDAKISQYFSALNRAWSVKMAVIVQEMVDAEKSGVVFGKDIQTGNEDLIVIDVAAGLGRGVVDGTAKTQRVVYSRSKDSLVGMNLGDLEGLLSKTEMDSLVEMTLSVEKLMGKTQDIEWAIDKEGNIWLIQTRDLG